MKEETERLDQSEPSGKCLRTCRISPFRVFDMMGNVEEWVTSRKGRRYKGALMGGFWSKPWTGCRGTNDAHEEAFTFYGTGFRCCADAGSLDGTRTRDPSACRRRERKSDQKEEDPGRSTTLTLRRERFNGCSCLLTDARALLRDAGDRGAVARRAREDRLDRRRRLPARQAGGARARAPAAAGEGPRDGARDRGGPADQGADAGVCELGALAASGRPRSSSLTGASFRRRCSRRRGAVA